MARDENAERYRLAAEVALQQLDWCVEYLRSIRKNRLAQELARNNASIRRRLAEPAGNHTHRA